MAEKLSYVQQKKSLIYFASGLRLNGVDNQAQLLLLRFNRDRIAGVDAREAALRADSELIEA